jgi:hypothetical protein
MKSSAARLATAAALVAGAQALPKITRTGRYLYDDSGNRSAGRSCVPNSSADCSRAQVLHQGCRLPAARCAARAGVSQLRAPQLMRRCAGGGSTGSFHEPTSFIDPLSSGANCTRDIPYLKQLGVNTVRVYSVNSSANHDDCMKALRYGFSLRYRE